METTRKLSMRLAMLMVGLTTSTPSMFVSAQTDPAVCLDLNVRCNTWLPNCNVSDVALQTYVRAACPATCQVTGCEPGGPEAQPTDGSGFPIESTLSPDERNNGAPGGSVGKKGKGKARPGNMPKGTGKKGNKGNKGKGDKGKGNKNKAKGNKKGNKHGGKAQYREDGDYGTGKSEDSDSDYGKLSRQNVRTNGNISTSHRGWLIAGFVCVAVGLVGVVLRRRIHNSGFTEVVKLGDSGESIDAADLNEQTLLLTGFLRPAKEHRIQVYNQQSKIQTL